MDSSVFGRLGQDYASAMAACLLQLRAAAPTEAATDTTSRRLVGRLLVAQSRSAAQLWTVILAAAGKVDLHNSYTLL